MSKTALATREQVLKEIESNNQFLLVTHEHVDGDALGSLIAMNELLKVLKKDTVMFMAPSEFPISHEYSFLDLSQGVSKLPNDIDERTIIFLDCGNIDRNPADILKHPGVRSINVDHHHDNTYFGTYNYVRSDASCTAEIVWDLMHGFNVEPNLKMAQSLYVGLVTDTGRFMYENTSPRAHRMAAELIEAGVDVHDIYRKLYEGIPQAKLELLALGLAKIKRFDNGKLTLTCLSQEDYKAAGAQESHSEGVIDYLRSLEGTTIAALIRDRTSDSAQGKKKVSLRSSTSDMDVSVIARAQGGGGHRQAAGFTTDLSCEQLIDFLRQQISTQSG